MTATTALAIGDFVRCSDGTPQPAAHHTKKLRSWKYHNFTGWIHSIEPAYGIGIDKTGDGILVNVMQFRGHTFTKEAAPGPAIHPAPAPVYKQGHSPWGKVDGHSPFGDLGLYHHSTSGHGGIYVPPEMKARMPKPYRDANHYGGGCWFEEDCEWALVALSFPSGVDGKTLENARDTVKNYHPHAYMEVTGEKLTREDSSRLAEEEDRESAKGKLVVVSAWGSWYKDRGTIPDGMVGCYAVVGGRNEHGGYDESTARYLLVPQEEYDKRPRFGFICEKDYPAWPALGEQVAAAPATKRIDPARAARALALFAAA